MNDKQYISFYLTGHDANICVYSSKTNKFLHLEFERIFGHRYFIFNDFPESQKKYMLFYLKNLLIDQGFEENFDLAALVRVSGLNGTGNTECVIDLIKSVFNIKEYVFFNHHECHASNVFYSSKFDSSLIFSFDGFGNDGNFCVYEASQNQIKKINPYTLNVLTEFYAYVGNFISEIKKNKNQLINMLSNPGKLMGLSAYGSFDNELYESIYNFNSQNVESDDNIILNTKLFYFKSKHLNEILKNNFDENSSVKNYNLAFNTQLAFENFFLENFKKYFEPNIHKNVCLSGGGALNVLLNERLCKMYPNTNFYISSSPSDCGLSYGAMCLMLGTNTIEENMYSGCPILDQEILPHILIYRSWKSRDIKKIAYDLYREKILGICRGNSEIGPRALGNRSIFANPTSYSIKDTINKKVKFREWFRPFAPICCEEDAPKYFETSDNVNYKYMTFSPKVKEQYRKVLPSITHVDGTSRLQTINYNQNPYVYELLKEFEKLSGLPILINTSFNIKGRPILTHYQAALQNLDSTELDGVILEDYYISK